MSILHRIRISSPGPIMLAKIYGWVIILLAGATGGLLNLLLDLDSMFVIGIGFGVGFLVSNYVFDKIRAIEDKEWLERNADTH